MLIRSTPKILSTVAHHLRDRHPGAKGIEDNAELENSRACFGVDNKPQKQQETPLALPTKHGNEPADQEREKDVEILPGSTGQLKALAETQYQPTPASQPEL